MCVCSPSQQGNGDLSEDVLHHQGHLGDFSKLAKFISDFEKAVFGEVYRVLPDIDQRGCRFHLTLQFGRRLVIKGLQSLFFTGIQVSKKYSTCS